MKRKTTPGQAGPLTRAISTTTTTTNGHFFQNLRAMAREQRAWLLDRPFYVHYLTLKILRVAAMLQILAILCQYVTLSLLINGPIPWLQITAGPLQALSSASKWFEHEESAIMRNDRLNDTEGLNGSTVVHPLQGQVHWSLGSWSSILVEGLPSTESSLPSGRESEANASFIQNSLHIYPTHIFLFYFTILTLGYLVLDLIVLKPQTLEAHALGLSDEVKVCEYVKKGGWWFLKPVTVRWRLAFQMVAYTYVGLSLLFFGQLPHNYGDRTCKLFGPLKDFPLLPNVAMLITGQGLTACCATLENGILLAHGVYFLVACLIMRKNCAPCFELMMQLNKSVLRSMPKINPDRLRPLAARHFTAQRKARSQLYFFDYYKVGNLGEQFRDAMGLGS